MTRLRILMMLVAAAALLAACGGQDAETSANEPTVPSASAEPSIESSTTSSTDAMDGPELVAPDYAALIATVESAVDETAYEGAVLEDVEVFIATAELFCDLLDEGMTVDEVLADYLDRLSEGGETEVDEEDALMAGVLLGAAMEIVCPDLSEAIP